MARIACAASSTVTSRSVLSSNGRRVWSMMPTPAPSASSQMLRMAWPATFMASGLAPLALAGRPQHAPGDRIEFLHQPGIALFGRGDQRVIERVVAALRAARAVMCDQRRRRAHQRLGSVGIGEQRADDHVDRDVIVARMPAVEIGHHRDGGVANLGLARELASGMLVMPMT